MTFYNNCKKILFSVAVMPVVFSSSPVSQLKSWYDNFDIKSQTANPEPRTVNNELSLFNDLKPFHIFPKTVLSISKRISYETDIFTESLFYISEQIQRSSDRNADAIAGIGSLYLKPFQKVIQKLNENPAAVLSESASVGESSVGALITETNTRNTPNQFSGEDAAGSLRSDASNGGGGQKYKIQNRKLRNLNKKSQIPNLSVLNPLRSVWLIPISPTSPTLNPRLKTSKQELPMSAITLIMSPPFCGFLPPTPSALATSL